MFTNRRAAYLYGAIFWLGASVPAAVADCTIDDLDATCTGDISGGVSFLNEVGQLTVKGLTSDIRPSGSDSAAFIGVTNPDVAPNKNIELIFDGGSFEVSVQGDGVTSSWISDKGADGKEDSKPLGGNAFGGKGDPGDDSGSATTVAIFSEGEIRGAGPSTALVRAETEGGDGGTGGEGSSDAGSGTGGFGGDGGSASLAIVSAQDGLFSNTGHAAAAIQARATGGDGGTGGEGFSLTNVGGGAFGGIGGDGGAAKTVLLDVQGSTAIGLGGNSIDAVSAKAEGGAGGDGGLANGRAGDKTIGGQGGAGGAVAGNGSGDSGIEVTIDDSSISQGGGSGSALSVTAIGGDGGKGGESKGGGTTAKGGDGGAGGDAGSTAETQMTVSINTSTFTVSGDGDAAIFLQSSGGAGGDGGSSITSFAGDSTGGDGGSGGAGGNITLNIGQDDATTITTITTLSTGPLQHGIRAESLAGAGGSGGDSTAGIASEAKGGDGGKGGTGGTLQINAIAKISTISNEAQGLWARSYGGAGGDGGNATAPVGSGQGGSAEGSGPGGDVAVQFTESVSTKGDSANAILAQSVGGFDGKAGDSTAFVAFGAGGQSAGDGGAVQVTIGRGSALTTAGTWADGVLAHSVGGGGGLGSSAVGVVALGGSGSAGGNGGAVSISAGEETTIQTQGMGSRALHGSSVGGGGGDGGSADAIVGLGGSGGSGGDGGKVAITNLAELTTTGDQATAFYGSTVGGGGGSANMTAAVVAIGGSGGDGGNGGEVKAQNAGNITTSGDDSNGIFLHSVGGGGGAGAGALSVAPVVSVAIGGSGGDGGDGGSVSYDDGGADGYSVATAGERARGLLAESVGGGGGDGGNSVSISGSPAFDISIGASGDGGKGGHGGAVSVTSNGDFSTKGTHSPSLHAQSTGGGGGSAGTSLSTDAAPVGVSLSVGGSGGGGGDGGAIDVTANGTLSSEGDVSAGLVAHSTGGGGGHSGTSVAGTVVSRVSLNASVGGSGGDGGDGGAVTVQGNGTTTTEGHLSPGVYAHSVGGGGGYAGSTAAMSGGSQGSFNAAVGGSAGGGGKGGTVKVGIDRNISTVGSVSPGVTALSVGGGGGHSGATVSGALASQMDANLSVGGSGGSGGDSGEVEVTSSGAIATEGHSSAAIVAHSSAGGGGAAHFAGAVSGVSEAGTLNASIGGSGGAAGNSGAVTVKTITDGDLTTKGHNAPGITAMSIGAGGGASGATAAVDGAAKVGLNIAVGGDGGAGSTAGTVWVSAESNISTAGSHSVGIRAQSVAGGGGDAGTVVTGSGASKADGGLTLGGSGASGGTAGLVVADNSGDITTSGGYASAIAAQSIGGGGGSAKGSIDVSGVSMGNVGVTIGGDGGKGGTASATSVSSTGNLTTSNHHAHGILARSHGGAGGDGGFAAQGGITAGETSGNIDVTLGGSGGDGGKADKVNVTASNSITTSDFHSLGIYAQSIGGNGGAGGNVYTGNLSLSRGKNLSVSVDIGGSGGSGGTADTATVVSEADISTDGFLSDGILAQSIGGNGGAGGDTYAVVAGLSSQASAKVDVTVGGTGGSGAVGGDVSVTNNGNITTNKGGSMGLFGHSIGGSGGKGGTAANLNINLAPKAVEGNSLNASFSFAVGGDGGTGNDAGSVKMTNNGVVITKGNSSKGLVAQSVGGGGGHGGTASSMSVSVSSVCKLLGRTGKLSCGSEAENNDTEAEIELTGVIGGSGGAGGNGGDVTATNQASLQTEGRVAHALVAQSVGGGGGSGADGDLGLAAWTTNDTVNAIDKGFDAVTEVPSFTKVSFAVGGSGGASGNGGSVTASNAFQIETKGDHSYGMHLQTIGGGGGNGGAGNSGLWAVATVGGTGSGGGDGGKVTITNSGSITTAGDGAVGIFAQSVGGGGGSAGDVEKGFAGSWDNLNIGVGVGIQEDSGIGGDGGDISATISGRISTSGELAHGLILQSVGGSGGVVGISGTLSEVNIDNFAGSAGYSGSGGKVTATISEEILVTGERAHGIFAQSVSGSEESNSGGDIDVTINGSVRALGKQGRGILAQSQGVDGGDGTITISIAEGARVETASDGWETIGLRNGSDNKITNLGRLLQEGGAEGDGYVIRTDGQADLTVVNKGYLEGSVRSSLVASGGAAAAAAPGSGTAAPIKIENFPDATFALGSEITLGDGGELSNSGTMSAGGVGSLAFSTVSGLVLQNPDGNTTVDIDFGRTNDLIIIEDSAGGFFQGSVRPNPIGGTPSDGTRGSFPFLRSDSDLAIGNLTVASTATIDYGLRLSTNSQNEKEALLTYAVDYTPWNGSATAQAKVPGSLREVISPNHTAFGDSIDGMIDTSNSNTEAFVSDLTNFLLTTESVTDLVDVYDRFAPAEIFAPSDAALFSSLRFADDLNSCPARGPEGQVVFTQQGSCVWLQVNGGGIDRQRTSNSIDYDESFVGVSVGGQMAVGEGYFLGGAFGYEDSNLSNSRFSGDGSRFQGGIVAKKEIEATTISASFSGGVGIYDLSRQVITPSGTVTADSSPNVNWISGHARVSHVVDLNEEIYVKPWFDLGIDHQWQGSFSETGAGDYGLDVESFSQTLVTLNPVVELGSDFQIFGAEANASASAGLLAIVSGRDRSTGVQLRGMGGFGPTYEISDQARPLFADVGANFEVRVHERALISLGGQALLAGNQQEYGGTGRVSIFF